MNQRKITRKDCLYWIEKPDINPLTGKIIVSEKNDSSLIKLERACKKFSILPFAVKIDEKEMWKIERDNHSFCTKKIYECGSCTYVLYALIDAHGNNQIARFIYENISSVFGYYIQEMVTRGYYNQIDSITELAYKILDKTVSTSFMNEEAGVSLTTILFFQNRFIIANIGNTRAIVYAPSYLIKNPFKAYEHDTLHKSRANKKFKTYYITPSHTVRNKNEILRVKKLKGKFNEYNGKIRLGYLELTRSIGDIPLRISNSGIGLVGIPDMSEIFNFSYSDMRKRPIQIFIANDEFWNQMNMEDVYKYFKQTNQKLEKKWIEKIPNKNRDIMVLNLKIKAFHIP